MSIEEDNKLIAARREKLVALREQGFKFPNGFRPDALAAELHVQYADDDNEALEGKGVKVKLAGRMMLKRVMGKASFCTIQDRSGRMQLFLQRDVLGTDIYQAFKSWDIGDVVAASGEMFRTKAGELSVRVERIELLTKALRPLPEKWAGLTDTESRYRQRYVDLTMNPEVREIFKIRNRIIKGLRAYFDARDFQEVETPMLQAIPGGATARPFITHYNALDREFYLRIAPELYLKRLVVGGFERVYEINRNFRNEGVSTRHNPEFTMLEFYQAYADYRDLMDMTEELLRGLAEDVKGDSAFDYQGQRIDFGVPFVRLTMAEAVLAHNADLSAEDLTDVSRLEAKARELKLDTRGAGAGKLLTGIFEETVEHKLIQPTFITGYPMEVSPLSRASDDNPELTDRFELFIAGREIANGFSELNDAEDQAARFRAQVEAKDAGDDEAMFYDADFVRALEYGMPPTAGEGIGVDRLTMLLTDAASIREVLLFPQLRPEA